MLCEVGDLTPKAIVSQSQQVRNLKHYLLQVVHGDPVIIPSYTLLALASLRAHELYLTWLRLLCSAYVVEVQKLPLKKLKFLDESHFDTRGSESVP